MPRSSTGTQPPATQPQQQPQQSGRSSTAELQQAQLRPNEPVNLIAPNGRVAHAAERALGYVPTFAEDPRAVTQAYQLIKTRQPLPAWLQGQEQNVEKAFKYHQQRNGNRPFTEWKYLPPTDSGREYLASTGLKRPEEVQPTGPTGEPTTPGLATVQDALNGTVNWADVETKQRQQLLADPSFYATGQITKYPKWMQQQIIADPSFDWKQLPKWQKSYFELSSSPAGMGAAQGALLGLGGGPVGGVAGGVLGGALGWAAAKSGYDPLKEAWQQKGVSASAFGWMNFLAEQAEKTIGFGMQNYIAAAGTLTGDETYGTLEDIWKDPKAIADAWNAGAVTGEKLIPTMAQLAKATPEQAYIFVKGLAEGAAEGKLRVVWGEDYANALLSPSEQYLGAVNPERSEGLFEQLTQARERINAGENYRTVMIDMQTGIYAQIGDMVLQAAADPLNVMPDMSVKGAKVIADASGAKVASQALSNASGLTEAARTYKTLVQSGQAMTIDPNFKVDRMGALSRFIAGVNDKGEVRAGPFTTKGLLDAPGKKKTGFLEEMTSLTPQSRAQTGAGMFYENIGALLNRFDDPHEAGKYLKALANSDMETWKELGSRFADSPEFYTVLPALKDYNAQGLDGITQMWDVSAPNREMLTQLADILGDSPAKLLDDLAERGTAEQDYQRIMQRLQQSEAPEARALLDEAQKGTFTPDSLKQTVEAFTGEGAMPWHPNQAKAMMLDSLGSHFDEWVTTRLMLDQTPEAKSAFFRTAALMKQAQSILLLGGSPGYAITNGLSNMVHRAASGLFGYLTPGQINGWMERFGVNPARFEEGVGIGGMIDQAAQKTGVKTEAQQKAVRGTGHLADAKDKLARLSRGMPFSRLSSWFEKSEGRQAFTIAMQQFWSQSWRRGVGFKTMDPQLVKALQGMGVDPNYIYAAIEAGMNQTEIERVLTGRNQGIQSRSLINEAARRTGLTAQQAADLLEKVGVLDTLDSYLKGTTTRDGVTAAFRKAEKVAQDYMDMRAGEDLKAIAEHVRQKVGLEGAASGLDVVQKVNGTFFDAWMDHFFRLGEVMEDLSTLEDPALRSKAIELQYQLSDTEFRRINARTAANYQGIFDVWGQTDNPQAMEILAAVAQSDQAMKTAYDFMRAERKQFFQEGRPIEEWVDSQARIDAEFERAFKHKHNAEVRMGENLGALYDQLYGPAAGEAGRKWWTDVTKFNDDIVKREKKARAEFAVLPKRQREAAKQKYYRETKIMLIAEAEKINEQGIARLERIIKKGGGKGQGGTPLPKTPTDPTQPGGPANEVDAMLQEAQARQAEEAQAKVARTTQVWDIAEEYARVGLPFDRTIFQDRFALTAALKNEEFGGFPDLQTLDDERLTPEKVRSILDRRAEVKDAETTAKVEKAASTIPAPKITDNTNILAAIKEHGGLHSDLAADLTGDTPRRTPGVFRKKGIQIDEMARLLADDGYPINLDDPNDPGGIGQATDLLNQARRGEKVYPIGHDFEAAIKRQEEAYAIVQAEELGFNAGTWDRNFEQAVAEGDLTRMYELIGDYPDDLINTPRLNKGIYKDLPVLGYVEGHPVYKQQEIGGHRLSLVEDSSGPNVIVEKITNHKDGTTTYKATTSYPDNIKEAWSDLYNSEGKPIEKWGDYLSRVADETVARVTDRNMRTAIDETRARIEADTQAGTDRADAAMTKRILEEKFRTVFNLTDEQANAYMELSEAIAGWYTRATGENADGFYSRYYKDVTEGGEGQLFQDDGGAKAELRQLLDEWDEGSMTEDDLIELAEGLFENNDMPGNANGIIDAIRDYKIAKEEDRTIWGKRGGSELEADNLVEMIQKYYDDNEDILYQDGRIESNTRRMTTQETESYARALVRAGADELRRAVQNEGTRADRIAILNAAHKLNPELAETVAKQNLDVLFQTAYHGTPYKFDKFTLDKIGTGEGAQVYGWGLYFAGEKKVAEFYREQISGKRFQATVDGNDIDTNPARINRNTIDALGITDQYDKQAAAQILNIYYEYGDWGSVRSEIEEFGYQNEAAMKRLLPDMEKRVKKIESKGQTYRVEIPDDNYLLWDRHLNEQPQAVRDVLAKAGLEFEEYLSIKQTEGGYYFITGGGYEYGKRTKSLANIQAQLTELSKSYGLDGRKVYKELARKLGSDRAASLALKEAGINGIQYLDGSSRSAGEGSFNYVIFDDNAIQILDTYYQATTGPTAKGAVTFGPDGIQATIHAFEAKDISTLVHENAHVFRRMLSDVSERTGNKRIRADLDTIEDWAGAKDGWTREAEEKFARGFEQYLTEGKAPNAKLKRAFESFKNWMLAIYKQITGTEIDARITDEVRQVFDRMLAENPEPDVLYQKKRKVDPNQIGMFGTEDLPLFSGTAQRAPDETFTPQQAVSQETMFDMRPQMKGAETRPSVWATLTPEQENAAERIFESMRANARKQRSIEEIAAAADKRFVRKLTPEIIQALAEEAYSAVRNDAGEIITTINPTLGGIMNSVGPGGELQPQNLAKWEQDQIQQQRKASDPNILFQDANLPVGAIDEASQFHPQSEAMDQGWSQFVKPLLSAMEETAVDQLNTKPAEALAGADDATQAQLRRYMRGVQNDMATSKLATVRYGEQQRDFAMLNYGKTYGFDRGFQVVSPYELYYTRSLFTWAARALDKPALFSNYARLRMQQQRYERDIPERLRGKIKIPAPFLPDWMGDGLYIDPLGQLFFPAQFLKPFERMEQDKTQQELEAERILQEWAADGSVSQTEIQQAVNKQGPAWERAIAEAQMRRESEIANPMDFFATMFGPAWYLSTPLNMAGIKVPGISKGDPNKVSTLPLTNTARAIDTVTQGSWAEPVGDLIGLIGKPEEWARKKAGLPTMGEYGEYYTKRQVANMVAEGLITSEDAQLAMIEKQGEVWDQATDRVKMELAMRVPGAAALYAGLHEGPKGLAQAALPSLFGAGLLPAGELEYRGLKQEWNEAWKKFDAGDKGAVTGFFDEHPEYEAYLAKGKDDGELMKSFMIGQIWDGYMALGATNQKQARAEMGELFSQAFLDKETRSYESIDTETLIQWAQMLNKRTPQAVNAQPLDATQPPAPELNLYGEDVTKVTDEYFRQRKENHGDYYALEQGYYSLPKSQRGSYLLENPELQEYWTWKKKWETTYPDLTPIFKGQVFKEIDTTTWPPGLVEYVTTYAYAGAPLKKGARKALEQQWIMEGRPMESLDTWLNSQVVPALLYGDQ
jgi:hypothetical protein